ncbi:kinase-like domain-containing protein [Emericellopsis atlantica]|uniref:Kinase-like domain-containing protein n=1 Tax=Emericellopsis atlantica TaxID=2614577 RepID=A0A9P7ZCM0_9HYPO|nr:kinase-like domain-containing protein [Emericellopsis atlantica]KAG9249728.1 kinase-like domain-containing protein [Emericellopsis atlantica]
MASQAIPNIDPKHIFAAVSELGIVGNCPFLDGEYHGGECRVFKLSFKDEASVAVRVPHPNDDSSHDNTIATVQIEVRILEELKAKGFPWAPRCLGASLTFDNPVNHPFVVLTWAEGLPLSWDENYPPRPLRDSLLGQLASIQLSLIQCTLQNGSTTAMAFFGRRIGNRLRHVREGSIPRLTEKDCLDQQALLDQVLDGDRNSTVFAIDHGDIKPGNIIVDGNYNIRCVIDWGFAALVPIARAAGLPRFLWPAHSARFAPSRTILKDRQAYTRSLSSYTSPAALFMLRWQTAEDVDFRTLYLESISSKGMHISMARIDWKVDCVFLGHDEEQGLADAQET